MMFVETISGSSCNNKLDSFALNCPKCNQPYKKLVHIYLFILFYLYNYPPDWQENNGGAIHRENNYPDLLPEMPSYCCLLEI